MILLWGRIKMLYQAELTEKYAKEISTWKYDNEYSVYNYPDWNIISAQKWAITVAEKRKNEFMAVINETRLCGYFRFLVNDQIVMVGLGLNPQFCGKGYGKQLMDLITREFEKRFTDKILELEVRTFNKRAIRCYLSAGFLKLHTYTKKTPIGTDTFLLMQYDKRN
jgi:ribosomal protein S18 acetylase RimI-like enzyme